MPEGNKIEIAADEFDNWMKNSKHPDFTDNKHLWCYLYEAKGFRYIKTYEEFCELSRLVQRKDYKTSSPPCTSIDFARAILYADSDSFGNEMPVITEDTKNELAKELLQSQKKAEEFAKSSLSTENPSDLTLCLFNYMVADNLSKRLKERRSFLESLKTTNVDHVSVTSIKGSFFPAATDMEVSGEAHLDDKKNMEI